MVANWLELANPLASAISVRLSFRSAINCFAWATRKEDQDLLDYLNAQLLKLKKAGVFNELQMKWFGFTMELPDVPTLGK